MRRSSRSAMLWVGVGWVLLSGCQNRSVYRDVVACADLPDGSAFAEADVSADLLLGLAPDQGRAVLTWEVGGVTEVYRTPPTSAQFLRNLNGGWAVQLALGCTPEATTSVHFAPSSGLGLAELAVQTYPVTAIGFDVPSLEQGDDPSTEELDATMNITSVEAGRVTGTFHGEVSVDLISFFGQRPLGIRFAVTSLAFRDVLDQN